MMIKTLTAKEIEFREETLENGLQVIYHIDRTAPIVSTIVHYKVGSKDEAPNQTGYAHFFEHLMFEATDSIPRGDIPKYINEAGGWLNAHTSFDETVYKFKVPSNDIKLALWIESQRMMGLQVEETGVNTQRDVVIEEKKQSYDNQPYGTMLEKMMSNLFPNSSYSWTVIGSEEHIKNALIENFQDFYDKFYRPSNAILVISGNFIFEDAQKYVKEYFGGLPTLPEPNRKEFKFPSLSKDYVEVVEDEKAPHKAIFMGYRGPLLGSNDYYAMNLLSNIVATGESSRLYRRLVDSEQIAIQASMMPLALEADGGIIFYAIANPGEELSDIENEIYEEINDIIENGVTDQELEKTKNITETNLINGKSNVMEKAMLLARYKAYYDEPEMINSEIDKYNKVTNQDIINVAKKYFQDKSKVVLNYIPKN